MRILSIGNSFSVDTMEYLPAIAADLKEDFYFGNLYIPGCPIGYHYLNAMDDLPVYKYFTNEDGTWKERDQVRIREAIEAQEWDWINIQHGSKDGRCYTDPIYYKHLDELLSYVRATAAKNTKISFNMAWVADAEYGHHEMVDFYEGQPEKMYDALIAITKNLVEPKALIDRVSPTGAAIQIARANKLPGLMRDGFHVSLDLGRYIAGLTFMRALMGADISEVTWSPEGVDDRLREASVYCALKAVECPWQSAEKIRMENIYESR